MPQFARTPVADSPRGGFVSIGAGTVGDRHTRKSVADPLRAPAPVAPPAPPPAVVVPPAVLASVGLVIDADGYAGMMLQLLPPGRLWRWVASKLRSLFLACADELVRLNDREGNLLDEADPRTAVELLPDYERELALASTGTNAERQARIVGRLVARQRYRPVDFQNALASLLGQLPANVVVIERTHAQAVAMGDDREIFRFFIYRDPTAPGSYFLASAQALVDQIKPSHTKGYVIESVNFKCDDPFSLCDRDILGA